MRRPAQNAWPIVLCLPLGILAAVAGRFALEIPLLYDKLLRDYPVLKTAFLVERIEGSAVFFSICCAIGSFLFLSIAILGLLVRRGWVLTLIRKGYVASYLLLAVFAQVVWKATAVVMSQNLVIDGRPTNPITVFFWRYDILWPAGLAVMLFAMLHVLSWKKKPISFYTGVPLQAPAAGDVILENLRSHGRDPHFRKSLWSSGGIHILIIVLIPWLLSMRGCVQDYKIQKGSGSPEIAAPQVKIMVKKIKKKKKKYVLNHESAISFHVPDLDDSPTAKEVETATQLTYKADPSRMAGTGKGGAKLGAGGGKSGGWPDGSEGAQFRFIRMEYNGAGWDDGMDALSRADKNFLDEFRKITGFKTAAASESHPIALLRKYKKGFAPPFVYMTGKAGINVSASDCKILREYLLDGGMLFADCGSQEWDRNFRAFMQSVFPGESLLTIADDDPIFQFPYVFPNGAPPLWHHGGSRALGMKKKGRWVVFYHPGDVNDAWKSDRSGMSPELARGAMEMGINIVYYSFTHYLEATRKYRK